VSQTVTADPRVPFIDLAPAHGPLAAAVLEDIAELIGSGQFANGPQVAEFETAFAAYCGVADCVGMSSGLDALRIALLAAGMRSGDEVIVPANSFVATFEAVSQTGATPVPVDVNEDDYNLDPSGVEAAVTRRTSAVVPVHLYGQMSDMKAIGDLATCHELLVVEDACQAHGATRDGLRAGGAGHAAGFSFYPGKNLGAFGDAGALVTSDAELADLARALREHGQRAKYRHEHAGYTARLDTIQAVVLLRKLPLLDRWNDERRSVAAYYVQELSGVGDIRLPPVPEGSQPVWHLFCVGTADPNSLADFLFERGIRTGRHYPEPPHLSKAYEYLGHGPGSFPVAERLCAELLSLPIFPGITETQLEAVVSAVAEFFGSG
jgi:dTDP-4-amino-4,6-dideoxygalactose transaminase